MSCRHRWPRLSHVTSVIQDWGWGVGPSPVNVFLGIWTFSYFSALIEGGLFASSVSSERNRSMAVLFISTDEPAGTLWRPGAHKRINDRRAA